MHRCLLNCVDTNVQRMELANGMSTRMHGKAKTPNKKKENRKNFTNENCELVLVPAGFGGETN